MKRYLSLFLVLGFFATQKVCAQEISQDVSGIITDPINVETDFNKTGNDPEALVRLLKIVKFQKAPRDLRLRVRLLNDLADVSAKLKMYPLAMKFYYKAVHWKWENQLPYFQSEAYTLDTVQNFQSEAYTMDTVQMVRQVALVKADDSRRTVKSEPISGRDIWEAFNDGKAASSYALLVEVKQPIPGKRRSFKGINNVGHTFITLIKYNTDNSFVSRSFGFYPHKSTIFSATPLHPASPSVFKDDTGHDWDEVVGKFISFRRFQRIIEMVKRYNLSMYNLNENNCTSFGLNAALIGGISIQETRGSWPLGKGDNPANAGQSILEGKISNIDTAYKKPLFVSILSPH